MVTVPNSDQRDIITRAPFLSDQLGEIVAWHDQDGPTIDLSLELAETDQRFHVSLSPSETRELADQLSAIADTAQRAGWTPDVIAAVRDRYLPGYTDGEIIERLDRLTHRIGGLVLGDDARVDWRAGRMLTAEVGVEALGNATAAVETASEQLTALRDAVDQLTQLRDSLDELKRFYQAESEKP